MHWPARLYPLLFVAALAVPTGCTRGVDPALYARFQAAQEEFDSASSPADFLRAAAIYQEILDAGATSGIVLYNQGNAFMRAGERGRAIACYRQAKRYLPRDPHLDANLRYALAGTSTPATRKPLLEYVLFWQTWISYPGKFRGSMLLAAATFAVAVASLFCYRRALARLAACLLLVTAAFSFSAAYDWYRFEMVQEGVIVSREIIARKGNAASYAPAFTQPLPEGTGFRVAGRRGGWLLIRLPGGQEGWIPETEAVVY